MKSPFESIKSYLGETNAPKEVHMELKKIEVNYEHYKQLATWDEKTQARRYNEKKMKQWILENPSGYYYRFDIDNFSDFNKHNGHQQGDFLLKELVETLSSLFTEADIYRYGGDEFDVLSPTLVTKLSQQTKIQINNQLSVTFSVVPLSQNSTLQDVQNQCDQLLFQHKNINS